MTKLSAIIITKNEERNIGRCIESIKDLVDEIIIVDSGSTDRTIEIARKYTDKIYFRQWTDDFAAQRNYALSKATGDWILSLDADEVVSSELKAEAKKFLSQKKKKI